MYKPNKNFALVSSVAVALAIAILAVGVRWNSDVSVLRAAEQRNFALAKMFSVSIWPRFGDYLTNAGQLTPQQRSTHAQHGAFESTIKALMARSPMLYVAIYDATGNKIFATADVPNPSAQSSSEPRSEGSGGAGPARQKPRVLSQSEQRAYTDQVDDLTLIDGRVPLLAPSGQRFASIQIVSDAVAIAANFRMQANRLTGIWAALFVALYLALLVIVVRADRLLRKQNRAIEQGVTLEATNRELENQIRVRQLAQIDLKQSESRFRDIAAVASDWFWETDADQRFTFMAGRHSNADVSQFIGLTLREQSKQSNWIVDEADLAQMEQDLSAHRPIERFEYAVRSRSGKVHYFRSSGAPFFDERGQFQGYRGVSTDVTAVRQAEAAVNENERRFRDLIGRLGEGVAARNAEGILTYVNQRFAELLGYTPDELLGHSTEILHPETGIARHGVEFERRREGIAEPYELKYKRKDGSLITLSMVPEIVQDEQGNFAGSVVVARDITQQKIAAPLQFAIDNLDTGLFLLNADFKITAFNRAMVELGRVSPDDVRNGMTYEEMLRGTATLEGAPPERVEAIVADRMAAMHRRESFIRETGADTSGRIYQISFEPMPDGGYAVTLYEITERKRIEAALQESEMRFRGMFENSAVAMASVGHDGTITMVNESFSAFIGYRSDELVGMSITDLIHPEETGAYNNVRDPEHSKQVTSYSFERRYLHKDGGVRWGMSSIYYQWGADGLIESAISQTQDITEAKRAELALRRSEERFRGVFEGAGVGMCIVSPGNTFVLVNDSLCHFLGYAREDLLGEPIEMVTHIEDIDRLRVARRRLFAGELDSDSFERRFVHRDGSVVWGITTLICARDDDGNPSHLIAQVQDITLRKEQEVALKQQEDRLRLTLDTASVGTWVRDYSDNTHYWDERTWRIFGQEYRPETDSADATFMSTLHPDDVELVRDALTEAESSGDTYQCEFRITLPGDGEIRHITSRGAVIRGGHGRVLRILGACMDITDIKRAEEQLRENHSRLSALHEITSSSALSVESKVENILQLGRSTFGLLTGIASHVQDDQFTVKFVVGPDGLLSAGMVIPLEQTFCRDVLASGQPIAFDSVGGTERESHACYQSRGIEAYIAAPIFVDGAAYGTLSFCGQDISAAPFDDADIGFIRLMAEWVGSELSRSRATIALNESEQRFRDIAESASDWFWEMDAEYHFTYLSDRGLDQYAMSIEDVVGKTWREVTAPRGFEIDEDDEIIHREALDDRQPFSDISYSMLGSSGERIYAETSGRPYFDPDGVYLGYRGVTRDVTARWKVQEELIAAMEDADLANQAKSRFLASASHDLRQPLQALNLFVSALSEMEADPKKQNLIGKTQSSVDALAGLLNALLDISKLEAGLVTPDHQKFPFSRLAKMAEEFEAVAAAKGLKLVVMPSRYGLRSDPVLLETILRNLLANAIKYTDSGKVLIGCRVKKGMVNIEVWDSGMGVPADKIDLIFEEFYQVGNAARDRDLGLGLGLSIVKRTAALLGHRVHVESRPGRGSKFSVEVPLVDITTSSGDITLSESDVVAPEPLPVLAKSQGKVIVIDDEPTILDSMELVLTSMGFDVTACRCSGPNCPDFLGLAERCDGLPDLIVSDYRLPEGMTGIDAVHILRDKFSQDIPAVLISGDISEETLLEVRAHNLTMLHKPVNASELRAVVSEKILVPG